MQGFIGQNIDFHWEIFSVPFQWTYSGWPGDRKRLIHEKNDLDPIAVKEIFFALFLYLSHCTHEIIVVKYTYQRDCFYIKIYESIIYLLSLFLSIFVITMLGKALEMVNDKRQSYKLSFQPQISSWGWIWKLEYFHFDTCRSCCLPLVYKVKVARSEQLL